MEDVVLARAGPWRYHKDMSAVGSSIDIPFIEDKAALSKADAAKVAGMTLGLSAL